MKNKKLKMLCIILSIIVSLSIYIVFFIPRFQFRTYEMNRAYGVTFGFISSILFLLLFWVINEIKYENLKALLIFVNGFLLFFAVGNLAFYYAKIDPDIQYRDYKVLFINKKKTNEKIVSQYYINWKTNEKIFSNNKVEDIGIFRIYKSDEIDTTNLDEKWITNDSNK